MRQALFAVVLVAASFAGGAVVNGPGLRWAQAMVLNRAGFGDGGAEAPAPAPPDGSIPPLSDAPLPHPPKAESRPAADAPGPSQTPARHAMAKPRAPEPPDQAPAEAPPAAPLPLLGPVPAAVAAERTPPAIEPPAALATSREREREAVALAAAAAEPPARKDKDAPVRLASLPVEPAAAAAPGPADWTEVRRSMRALGVSRYGVEGDPNGRVRFHCVIPLAGRRAVGQHFEAEGDDELEAARSALRRVALWRATEAGGPAP